MSISSENWVGEAKFDLLKETFHCTFLLRKFSLNEWTSLSSSLFLLVFLLKCILYSERYFSGFSHEIVNVFCPLWCNFRAASLISSFFGGHLFNKVVFYEKINVLIVNRVIFNCIRKVDSPTTMPLCCTLSCFCDKNYIKSLLIYSRENCAKYGEILSHQSMCQQSFMHCFEFEMCLKIFIL